MTQKTLVLGASLNKSRYSNLAIHRLREKNIPVVAYGLKEGIVNDITIDSEMIPYENIDTITLYLNPRRQKEYYDYILSLHPKRVIFNPGTENPELVKLLQNNGVLSEEACTLVLLSINQY